MRITNTSGAWTSAELYTIDRFTFGTFQWQVQALLNDLDPKVVLNLNTYGPTTFAEDGTNQIDIGFTRWGRTGSSAPNLFYNVWPANANQTRTGISFVHLQRNMYSTHRFTWSRADVTFKSMIGFRKDDGNLFHSWKSSANFASAVPQTTAPVHINLWVFPYGSDDFYPTDGKPVEVIIHDFTYLPLPSSGRRTLFQCTYTLLLLVFLSLSLGKAF